MTRIGRNGLLFGILLLTLSGCAAARALVGGSGTTTGTISGHIQVRACGGAAVAEGTCPATPIPGVVVQVQAQGGGQPITATTDSTGTYRVRAAPGSYVVRLDSQSLLGLAGSRQVTVGAGQTISADFTLTGDRCSVGGPGKALPQCVPE
jgi:Carboxypeptidase regulatory-like domain